MVPRMRGLRKGQSGRTADAPPQPVAVPKERFCHVHVDIVGPLPPSPRGHTHLLSVIDRTSRWPELFPLRDTSARACADVFTSGWVARYGVPETMTTDRGVQFTSEVWRVLCETLGIQHIKTTAYHPQSNGMVERLHRQVKEALRARRCGSGWLEHLPWVLLGIRSAPKEECGISAAEAVFGIPLTIPGQVARPAEKEGQPVINMKPRTYAEVARPHPRPPFVYVRRGQPGTLGAPIFDGPYAVKAWADKYYDVMVGDKCERISIDRLKPYTGIEQPEVALPPRGRSDWQFAGLDPLTGGGALLRAGKCAKILRRNLCISILSVYSYCSHHRI
jgi:hypothetical protein